MSISTVHQPGLDHRSVAVAQVHLLQLVCRQLPTRRKAIRRRQGVLAATDRRRWKSSSQVVHLHRVCRCSLVSREFLCDEIVQCIIVPRSRLGINSLYLIQLGLG